MTAHIAITNQSTVLGDDEVAAVLPAVQAAHHDHFRPAWGSVAKFSFIPGGAAPPAGAWPAYILDDSDQAGALGYHGLSGKTPYLRVFAKTDAQYGLSWTVTLTHEIWEALADPYLDTARYVGGGVFYAVEVGDPVEADTYAYDVQGVQVSDFVLPAWYDGMGTRYDHAGHCTRARQVLQGGYQSKFVNGAWQQREDADEPRVRVRPS